MWNPVNFSDLYLTAKITYYKNIKMLNKSEPQTLEEQKTELEFSIKTLQSNFSG